MEDSFNAIYNIVFNFEYPREERQAEVKEIHYDIPAPKPAVIKSDDQTDKPTALPKLQLNAEPRQALVVYDYWAHNNKELTIRAGEKVLVSEN